MKKIVDGIVRDMTQEEEEAYLQELAKHENEYPNEIGDSEALRIIMGVEE